MSLALADSRPGRKVLQSDFIKHFHRAQTNWRFGNKNCAPGPVCGEEDGLFFVRALTLSYSQERNDSNRM
jgi:hypothetical protein